MPEEPRIESKLTRIANTFVLPLLLLLIVTVLGLNVFLLFKYFELQTMVRTQGGKSPAREFNPGKYIDYKTTIEEQRKEIIRLQNKNDRCLDKLDKTIADLDSCRGDEVLREHNLSEERLLE